MLLFYCLIAGIGREGKSHLVNAGKFKSRFDATDVPMILYQSADTKQEDCNQMIVKNYQLRRGDFCECFEFGAIGIDLTR